MSIITNFNKCSNQSTNWSPFVNTCKQRYVTKLNPKFQKFIKISFANVRKYATENRNVAYDLLRVGHARSNIFLRIHLVIFRISFDLIKIQIFSIDFLFVFGTSEKGQNLQKSLQILVIQSLLL